MRELKYSDYYASFDELKRTDSYVQGSNVLQMEPARREKRKEKPLRVVKKTKKVSKKVGKSPYSKSQILRNRFNLAITMTALVAVCFSCINYLQLQSEVSARSSIISKLEAEYVDLKTENDLTEVRISSSIDYNHILDVAINELGMVYAKKDQLILYNSEEMEFVKQLYDIPTN